MSRRQPRNVDVRRLRREHRAGDLRRAGTVCVLALAALSPSACGDVLVPADPPARTAETVAAGGDVIVFNRERRSFALVAGLAVRVLGTGATTAVANDGTAVIASRT